MKYRHLRKFNLQWFLVLDLSFLLFVFHFLLTILQQSTTNLSYIFRIASLIVYDHWVTSGLDLFLPILFEVVFLIGLSTIDGDKSINITK